MTSPTAPAARRVAWWRYLVPNAFTALSLVFGVLGVQAATRGRPVAAMWWSLYCTLTDRLDGAAAKALGAQSAFGIQFDSLADLLSFGVVPPTAMYVYFQGHGELGWAGPTARVVLTAICVTFTLAAAVRLARFNVGAESARAAATSVPHYTGTPSTMTAGLIGALFLAALKYAPAHQGGEGADDWRWLGGANLSGLLRVMPLVLLAGAVGMVSPLRVPRLGRTRHRVTTVVLAVAVVFGYAMGLLHRVPEYLAAGGLFYLAVCVAFHARTGKPPLTHDLTRSS